MRNYLFLINLINYRIMLTIALPSSGPLYQSTIEFFNNAGITIKKSSLRSYTGTTSFDDNVKMIFQRQTDIPSSINNEIADIGVMGLDRYLENNDFSDSNIIIEKMGYGQCDLVVAVPQKWGAINNIKDLVNYSTEKKLKIATKYPNQTAKYLNNNNLESYEIVATSGSVEVAPEMGLADMIVDISSTGNTIRANNLKILDDGYILFSEATMIANLPSINKSNEKFESAKKILRVILGYLNSKKFNTIIFNINSKNESTLVNNLNKYSSLQGVIGPTIAKVYSNDQKNWYAVTIIVSNENLNAAINDLDELAAEGVTVIENKLVFNKTLNVDKLLKK